MDVLTHDEHLAVPDVARPDILLFQRWLYKMGLLTEDAERTVPLATVKDWLRQREMSAW